VQTPLNLWSCLRNQMLVNQLRDIVSKYRLEISIDSLEHDLVERSLHGPDRKLVNHTSIFPVSKNSVFVKSGLLEHKQDFMKEFSDYLQGRLENKVLRDSITGKFMHHVPDALFIEWLDVSLDRRLVIFELLYTMIIKPANSRNRLRNSFTRLIEFYSLLVLYVHILSENFNSNYEEYMTIIERIEENESILQNHFFNLLTVPDLVEKRLNHWNSEYLATEQELIELMNNTFGYLEAFSQKLVQRVIKSELKHFDIVSLLSRFEHRPFYDWILVLFEEETLDTGHNLFDDLGL
jgi:hypothetical protein